MHAIGNFSIAQSSTCVMDMSWSGPSERQQGRPETGSPVPVPVPVRTESNHSKMVQSGLYPWLGILPKPQTQDRTRRLSPFLWSPPLVELAAPRPAGPVVRNEAQGDV